jgi:uncharacterized protein (TIGR00730 family)
VKLQHVAVYCGSSPGRDPAYVEGAAALGRALSERGIGLVYGGGRVGLMGALADAALAAGGTVTGVITEALMTYELANRAATELLTVRTMHERKLVMSERADAFVMLPGGFGTLDEFFEALTWAQLGIHAKPCAVLDPLGYYEPLLTWVDRAVDSGFVAAENRSLLLVATEPRELLTRLEAWRPPVEERAEGAGATPPAP